MTAAFGLIGHPVNFFSTWQGDNSYHPPIQSIPGFTKEFNLSGYSFGDGDKGNSKFISIGCINIVVAANAGGAYSPFGDITTLMVWQKGVIDFFGFSALIGIF